MDEKDIFEAFGINPTEESEGGKEQEVAAPASQAEAPEGESAASEAERSPGEGQEDAGREQPGGEPAEMDEDQPGTEKKQPAAEPQTEEQRRENAAQRRRQEQQEAIDKAVSEALEQERERTKGEWSAFFAKARLKNSITGMPITTLDEFNEWFRAYDAAKLSDDLKEGRLTPEALDKAIADNPAVKRAEEIVRKEEESRRQQEEAAAKARIDAEIQEIHKLDPAINSMEDLLKMPNARQFYEYVKRGNSFLDAWYLTNREKMTQQTAEAAKQQAMNAARSKDHLKSTANARGAGAASVPAEEMRMFRLFNPDTTEAEIQAYYNKQKN